MKFGRALSGLAPTLLLAACAMHHEPPPTAPAPTVGLRACMAGLDGHGVAYRRVADFHNADGCGISEAVRVEHGVLAWNQPLEMACPLALAIADFESQAVQPEAMRFFGRKATMMWNLGAYACRGQDDQVGGRLSQHAFGMAVDIDGFDIEGGETVRVKRDWHGDDARARFLHAVAADACRIFHAVLTPDADAYHLDHIHMDLGPYRLCRA